MAGKTGLRAAGCAVVFLLFAAPACAGADAVTSLILRTVDTDGVPLSAERLEWWREPDRRQVHSVSCAAAPCSRWELGVSAEDERPLEVYLLRGRPGDAACWDTFRGTLDGYAKPAAGGERAIVVTPADAVCAGAAGEPS